MQNSFFIKKLGSYVLSGMPNILLYKKLNMIKDRIQVSFGRMIVLLLLLVNAVILKIAFTGNSNWYWALLIFMPLLLLVIINVRQKKHAILRNFPLIGYLRYFFESIRPQIRQYFFESDLNGSRLTGGNGQLSIKERKTRNKR